MFSSLNKFFCYKTDKNTKKYSSNYKNSSNILYYKLKLQKNNFEKFIQVFLKHSKNFEIQNLFLLEKFLEKKKLLLVIQNLKNDILIKELNKKKLEKNLYNFIFNYFNYLYIKSKIILHQKKFSLEKIKKLFYENNDKILLVNILKKKINYLLKINLFLKNNFFHSSSFIKKIELFENLSLKIFELILFFSLKIKKFSSVEKRSFLESISNFLEINENYFLMKNKINYRNLKFKKTHILKIQKKNKKLQKLNKIYIPNILYNIRNFILGNTYYLYKRGVKIILENLLKNFRQEIQNLILEIKFFTYHNSKIVDLSTIKEVESNFEETILEEKNFELFSENKFNFFFENNLDFTHKRKSLDFKNRNYKFSKNFEKVNLKNRNYSNFKIISIFNDVSDFSKKRSSHPERKIQV